jgi:cell division protein FtsL
MSMESNNNDTGRHSQHRTHRSRRSGHSLHSRLKIWGLSAALLTMIVILFITIVYTSSRIKVLSDQTGSLQQQLYIKEQEVDDLKSRLTQSKNEQDKLIEGRLPSVMKLVPDQVLAVNSDFIKNIVFTEVNEGGAKRYEYKLVVENPSHTVIVPKFRLLIFDKYGVQIGMDQVLRDEELGPGESRSYSSKVDFFMKEEPVYFHVSSTIPAGSERMQGILK